MTDGLTTRVVEDETDWDALRGPWDALYRSSPRASTPLDFQWLRCWWEVYGPAYGLGGLRIITLWRGETLAAVLPLYVDGGKGAAMAVRCLRFLSTGEAEYEETCPDYLDLLHLPGEGAACAEAAWAAVNGLSWDTLELLDLPGDSPLRYAGNAPPGMKVASRGVCPVANLEGGFEAYLQQLSYKTRKRARQEIRKVEQAGAQMQLATPDESAAYFEDLVRLHQARWTSEGKAGCFAAPRFTEFNRRLIDAWSGTGRVVLARLALANEAYVVLYGFVTGAKFDLYQTGVGTVEGTAIYSPGTVSNLLLMGALADRGVVRYDFLRGESAYKKSLTSEGCELISLHCFRGSVRTMVDCLVRFIRRAVRKVLRVMTRR
ncbi:GNAT family N-acetyltransferase [Dyella sp.]|jgi:CelD/BcsL family acetyltransferase involved in cellulose biosynthesis|uniref:GNAT family N-acetyltransferase n=1 Tax=Dyella sp. TaxID=1869338 RepID=UPI002D76E07B|nr:GNAT family N-acetyltransferase [Dyella sp.]HET6432966.1 GNAT family N-acetyltransferase [Dyella sp.]